MNAYRDRPSACADSAGSPLCLDCGSPRRAGWRACWFLVCTDEIRRTGPSRCAVGNWRAQPASARSEPGAASESALSLLPAGSALPLQGLQVPSPLAHVVPFARSAAISSAALFALVSVPASQPHAWLNPPPCFYFAFCRCYAALEKQGKSLCPACARACSGREYPLRVPSRLPLYPSGKLLARELDMIEPGRKGLNSRDDNGG